MEWENQVKNKDRVVWVESIFGEMFEMQKGKVKTPREKHKSLHFFGF